MTGNLIFGIALVAIAFWLYVPSVKGLLHPASWRDEYPWWRLVLGLAAAMAGALVLAPILLS